MAVSSTLPEEIDYIDFAGVTTTTQQPKIGKVFLKSSFSIAQIE